ncbi:hypothetical protein ACWENR_23785 [Micromonospora sp. NPDC004336]
MTDLARQPQQGHRLVGGDRQARRAGSSLPRSSAHRQHDCGAHRASTRELMARMGHDSPQAAMIYQHATSEADRAIAQAVSDRVKAERKKAKKAAAGPSDKPKAKGKKAGKKRA